MNRFEFEQSLTEEKFLISPDGVNKYGQSCWWVGFDKTIEGEDEWGNKSGVFIGKLKMPQDK